MTDNLSEIAARWLGMDLEWHLAHNMKWNPLEDRNDLVRVEEKLCRGGYRILFYLRSFIVDTEFNETMVEGERADYPTALLELVKTLYERGKGNE